MILGDSLLVMNSLAEKEGLRHSVQTIYIDPPYGVKFGSNWQVSTRKREVKDGKLNSATRQPEQIRAFRDTWNLGIHSYLAYLRERLIVSRELLAEAGSLFLQIGDENVHLARCLMDEIFGSENFVAIINIAKTSGATAKHLPAVADYILWYAHNIESLKYRQLYSPKSLAQGGSEYKYIYLPNGEIRALTKNEKEFPSTIPSGGRLFRPSAMTSQSASETTSVEFEFGGEIFKPGSGGWKTNLSGFSKLVKAKRIIKRDKSLSYIRYLDDFPVMDINNIWMDVRWGFDAKEKRYVVETHPRAIERCILMSSDPGDIVLDPTCGSGTTALVAEQWGRRWITIDTSRVALALARTRLLSPKFPYYFLADSRDGIQKESEIAGKKPPSYDTDDDIRKGFVYKRVPHITLKSIANNPDITDGMSRDEIDKAIARYADQELLFDQPYEDNSKVRVTGPFTVESLSPHRVLAAENNTGESEEAAAIDPSNNFGNIIIENLRKAGVQNTVKNERIRFDWLEAFAGTWIHATGEFIDRDGKAKRIAISIGPEHGTVGPQQVKEAAKEAVQGVGYDVLVVCGFAFDPHVSEEAKRYGELMVLPTRMNPDLAMGDELLKKTGTGNLFMVFGEPDLKVKKEKDGNISVELVGLDVYDPTTGEIRNSSTDDIACWFIDTEYNGESFFVRHAYFTGGDKPYEKLQRALHAEINEEAWESLYSTKSRPFPKPSTGKIAVKVINHYGDEVLKVYEV
jgi:adenine-specific DNA-methyltransferase